MGDLQSRGKCFSMLHTIKKVSELSIIEILGHREEHFGVKWEVIILREDDHLAVYLKCLGIEEPDNWSIDAQFEISTLKVNDNSVAVICNAVKFTKEKNEWGAKDFIEWEKLKSLVVGDELTIVIEMKIKKMIGVYKPNLRSFDESMKTYSDVILEVQNVKFYVTKLFIALHSPFFKKLLLDGPPKSKVTLTDVDSDDFQNYLEVLYGDSAIDDITVEGVLFVAKKYNTQIVTNKCENFLLAKSNKSNEKKKRLTGVYNLKKMRATGILRL